MKPQRQTGIPRLALLVLPALIASWGVSVAAASPVRTVWRT